MLMDKKALMREYKETPRPMGVYQIRNTANGKLLVGTSVNLPAILNRHRAALRMGSHQNRGLQKDWAEFGPDAFEFEVLDTLAPPERPDYKPSDDLKALEQLWLDKLSPFGERGYNPEPKRPA
jgi:group I intron endonuclease